MGTSQDSIREFICNPLLLFLLPHTKINTTHLSWPKELKRWLLNELFCDCPPCPPALDPDLLLFPLFTFEVARDIGPPTSIGDPFCECLCCCCGLPPEFLLNRPGDGDRGLPIDPDCCEAADCGLLGRDSGRSWSMSRFLPGLGGALDSRSSSPSPIMSGDELLLVLSILSEDNCGPLPLSRFLCSSFRRSDLRHLARRFWNQTC